MIRRTLVVLAVAVTGSMIATPSPALAVAPPCAGAWTIDEPVNIRGALNDVDVAPDGTVVSVTRANLSVLRVVRRDPEGVWDELPTVPGDRDGFVVADGFDDITVISQIRDSSTATDVWRPVAWRFDGVGWSEEEGLPAQHWFITDVDDRGGTIVVGGSYQPARGTAMRAGILVREGGFWSRVRVDLDAPRPGDFLRLVRGVAVGGSGRLWFVAAWSRRSRGSALAVQDEDGRWKGWHPRALSPRDLDVDHGVVVMAGPGSAQRDLAMIGRPGAWRLERLPAGTAEVAVRSGTDVWLWNNSIFGGVTVHIDARGAARMPLRLTPAGYRSARDVAFAPDGSAWSVGFRGDFTVPWMAVEHLCPWNVGAGDLDPQVLRTPAPSTGVLWRAAEGAGPQVIVDRSPFRLFDVVLRDGEVVSVAYPGVGRFPFRDVRTGRNGVVSVAMVAYRSDSSPGQIELWLGDDFRPLGYRADVRVLGPDDDAYREIFDGSIGSAQPSWSFDQGPGTYRFRARMIAADGTVGEWSPISTVTID